MTLIAEHIEGDTRDRILEVAERLFRQIGYQKTTERSTSQGRCGGQGRLSFRANG
jgi:hypothetical protein